MAELSKDFKKNLQKALDNNKTSKQKQQKKQKRQESQDAIMKGLTADPKKNNYDLYPAILKSTLYKSKKSYMDKSDLARDFIDSNVKGHKKSSIKPGMLLMFNYFEPKTKDEMLYYDAMPCTIFFGIVNTKDGKRVLGFNLHYYPPKLRYQLLGWIYKTFKSDFERTWDQESVGTISQFSYKYIMKTLAKKDLTFGVRMYIPGLMSKVKQIYPKYFEVAVFTEGEFKKQTRQQILNYWQGKVKSLF